MPKEASYYHPLANGRVKCELCPHICVIAEGKRGKCMLRLCREGKLWADGYGKTISLSIDPMEKKPIYHLFPGSQILSVGGNGCNLSCDFCQNWNSSQQPCATGLVTPQQLVELAQKEGSVGVSYTYTEPLVWFEFVLDCAKLVHQAGMINVLVSNGYVNPQPLAELLPLIDAINIDLKSMDEEFYKKRCKAHLAPVLATIKTFVQAPHCLVELTNLLIPGANDSEEQIQGLVDFVAGQLSPDVPLHFSRYFPQYKAVEPSTSMDVLERAGEIARQKLKYVYIGNVQSPSHTYCPQCGQPVVERWGYTVRATGLKEGKCTHCGYNLGIGKK
jgi:pyruvate formate lyase activating enzyme